MKRPTLFTLLLVAVSALGGVWACSDSGPNGPGARVPVSFGLQPALDTVPVGDTVLFVAQRADSTVDEWTLSDTSIARLLGQDRGQATILTRAAGTVTVKATRQGDSGQATLVIVPLPPPPPAPISFGILPGVDTTMSGFPVLFFAERADSTVDQWTVSGSGLAFLGSHQRNWAWVLAVAPGTVTVDARRGSDSGQATLVILPPDTPAGWEAITIGPLDGITRTVTAINDDGTVVGYGEGSGFVYKNGVMRKLVGPGAPKAIGPSGTIAGTANGLVVWDTPEAAPRAIPGAQSTETISIIGVNAQGDILADHGDLLGSIRAVVWRNAGPEDLGSLNDSLLLTGTVARAWNERGQIVGGSRADRFAINADYVDVIHPFLWEDGVMRDLGALAPFPCPDVPTRDCSGGWATGINALGVVVGYSPVGTVVRAFIWEDGVMRDLGVFPGQSTAALAINDREQVLGTVGRGYLEEVTTFFWDQGQVQIVAFGAQTVALGPNGEVVGTMKVAGGESHAFLWQAGHLTDLGRGVAVAINGRGEIIGNRGSLPTLWRRKGG